MKIVVDEELPASCLDRLKSALRMEAAGGVDHEIVLTGSWQAIKGAVAGAETSVSMHTFSRPDRDRPMMMSVRRRYPHVPFIAYLPRRRIEVAARIVSDDWPVQSLLIEDVVDSPREIAAALTDSRRKSGAERLHSSFTDLAGERVGEALSRALRDEHRVDASRLAEHYGTSPRTLRRHLADAGLPAPGRWASWLNVMEAAILLGDPDRTTESAAFEVGYGSGAALSQVCRRLVGEGISRYRGEEGLEKLLGHLRREIRDGGSRSEAAPVTAGRDAEGAP